MLSATITQKLRLYAREARFALQASRDIAGCTRLLGLTAMFHARNFLKIAGDDRRISRLNLVIRNYPFDLQLRLHGSDIAVLYEVLAREAYYVPPEDVPPDSVGTVIDAGANIGLSALYFASRYPNARILAIEPNPENFSHLMRNTQMEPRINPVQACVTPLPRQKVFITTSGPAWGYRSNTVGQGCEVLGACLSELMADYNFDSIDLLKVDIEGAERDVFAKADFLDRTRAIVAELHGGYDLDSFNLDLAPTGHVARVNPHSRDPAVVLATRNRH